MATKKKKKKKKRLFVAIAFRSWRVVEVEQFKCCFCLRNSAALSDHFLWTSDLPSFSHSHPVCLNSVGSRWFERYAYFSSLFPHVKIGSQHSAPLLSQAEKPFLLIIFKTLITLENGFRRRSQSRYRVRQGQDTNEQSAEDNSEKGRPSSLGRQSCHANTDHQ